MFFFPAGFPKDILTYLEQKGHEIRPRLSSAVVQGVVVGEDGQVMAHADSRKKGKAVIVNVA